MDPYTGLKESSLKYNKLVAALAVFMSDNSELTISIEGVSHSEERSGDEERLGEMHKVVWRLYRLWVARVLEVLRTNGVEDHSFYITFSLHIYRKVMFSPT
jgi:very-short-patch-repair endonuclease